MVWERRFHHPVPLFRASAWDHPPRLRAAMVSPIHCLCPLCPLLLSCPAPLVASWLFRVSAVPIKPVLGAPGGMAPPSVRAFVLSRLVSCLCGG